MILYGMNECAVVPHLPPMSDDEKKAMEVSHHKSALTAADSVAWSGRHSLAPSQGVGDRWVLGF